MTILIYNYQYVVYKTFHLLLFLKTRKLIQLFYCLSRISGRQLRIVTAQ
jgi:hypothetical protein